MTRAKAFSFWGNRWLSLRHRQFSAAAGRRAKALFGRPIFLFVILLCGFRNGPLLAGTCSVSEESISKDDTKHDDARNPKPKRLCCHTFLPLPNARQRTTPASLEKLAGAVTGCCRPQQAGGRHDPITINFVKRSGRLINPASPAAASTGWGCLRSVRQNPRRPLVVCSLPNRSVEAVPG
jgi:hypothetical protein